MLAQIIYADLIEVELFLLPEKFPNQIEYDNQYFFEWISEPATSLRSAIFTVFYPATKLESRWDWGSAYEPFDYDELKS